MEESIILVDQDGELIGTVDNPIMCVVASPGE